MCRQVSARLSNSSKQLPRAQLPRPVRCQCRAPVVLLAGSLGLSTPDRSSELRGLAHSSYPVPGTTGISGALRPSSVGVFGGSSERWLAAERDAGTVLLLAPFLEGAGGADGLGAAGSQLGGAVAPSHPLMP